MALFFHLCRLSSNFAAYNHIQRLIRPEDDSPEVRHNPVRALKTRIVAGMCKTGEVGKMTQHSDEVQ